MLAVGHLLGVVEAWAASCGGRVRSLLLIFNTEEERVSRSATEQDRAANQEPTEDPIGLATKVFRCQCSHPVTRAVAMLLPHVSHSADPPSHNVCPLLHFMSRG